MAKFTDYYNGTGTGFSALTTTGTTHGPVQDVSMREQIGIVLTSASIAVGQIVFSVDGSNDGTNFVTGLAFVDATSTSSTTYVTSKTMTTNTTVGIYLPIFPFRYIRITGVVTTDGAYTATMQAKG